MAPLDSTFGAMLIGVYCATFLQGLLTLQTYYYYDKYPRDPIFNKLIVCPLLALLCVFIVWFFDAIHLILIAKSAYYYLVTQWGNQEALSMSIWELDVQLTFIGLSTIGCQIFFLNRIWILSHKNIILVVFLLCLCLASFILEIVVTVRITSNRLLSEFGEKKAENLGIFTFGAAADVLIAASLCYYLRWDNTMFQSTKSMVKKVVQFALATGIVTSAFAVASIIAYLANETALYFIAIHFSLGRMYTNSLLASLNAREKLRATSVHFAQTSSGSRREVSTDDDGRPTSSVPKFIGPFRAKHRPQSVAVECTVGHTTENSDIELSDSVKSKDIV